ncbi:MAG: phosphate acyltransferase PlsX [Rubrobacter sp.]|nr:phosphate acyltransferase PlsX [Rubrobacter sp.]
MRIAVDALGGDNAPDQIIAGSLVAAREMPNDEVILVGDEASVEPRLRDAPDNVSFCRACGAIAMNEDPAKALRTQPDSSVVVAARMVCAGEAGVFFSAGNTGATVAAALLEIGRIRGCRRPAIATVLPFDAPVLLLDAGATVSCRPQDLLNFAILGSVFARRYLGIADDPRVGLINVGEEPGKGNNLAKAAHELLSRSNSVHFVGNVEGYAIGSGVADVLVTDGFTGNVVLKTTEGVAREILGTVHGAVASRTIRKLAGSLLRPQLVAIREQLNPENYGGSFLLGVHGLVVIGHGNSRARGVFNALKGISRAGSSIIEEIQKALATAGEHTTGDTI